MTLEEGAWIASLVSVGVAVGSGVVAWLARRDARRSAAAAERAALAAERSAHADESLTAIEVSRRHESLTPDLFIEATSWAPGNDGVRLSVKLRGPHGLDRLDEVEVRVRDDKDRSPQVHGEPTQEQIDATIWGPYRFEPSADGADRNGRRVAPFALRRGDERALYMRPSLPPSWSTPLWWLEEYVEQPIRLEITCVRAGDAPWRLVEDVPQPVARFDTRVQRTDAGIELVARNVGEGPAYDVSVTVHTDAVRVLQLGRIHVGVPWPLEENETAAVVPGDTIRTILQATAPLTSGRRDARVDLTWRDQRGAHRSQEIDIAAGLARGEWTTSHVLTVR